MSQQLFVGEMPVRGSNLLATTNVVPEGYARYLQDIIIDPDGTLRRRGPLKPSVFDPSDATWTYAMVSAYTPVGTYRYLGIGTYPSSTNCRVWSDAGAVVADFNQTDIVSPGEAQWCSDFNGGAIIGDSVAGVFGDQHLYFWRGAYVSTTNGATLSTTIGSTALAGAGAVFVAGHVGAFVSVNGVYVGCIKSVTSTTAAVLEEGALATSSSATNTIRPVRGLNAAPSPGLIHTETATTSIVGSGTKFLEQGTGAGTWDIFHLRADGTSTIVQSIAAASVTNNTNIAFTTAPNYNMDFERYKLNARGQSTSTIITDSGALPAGRTNYNTVGCLPAAYADRMWYASRADTQENKSSIWFSERLQSENIDLSPTTGSRIVIGTEDDRSDIVATIGTSSGLIIFKRNVTYILTGKSPTNFQVNRLLDDGIICAQAVRKYAGGAVWAGAKGIYYFDGASTVNLVEESLGNQYETFFSDTSMQSTGGAACFVSHNHLFVSYSASNPWASFTRTLYAPLMRGDTSYYADDMTAEGLYNSVYTTPYDAMNSDEGDGITFCINLQTFALTFMRNMTVTWALPVIDPTALGSSEDNLLVVNNKLGRDISGVYDSYRASIVGSTSVFDEAGLDQVDTNPLGVKMPPCAYWQTFYDTFSSSTLNTNWTSTGNFTLSGGNLVPTDSSGWSTQLAPAWTSGQPYNFMRMHFTTGSTVVGFANRCRIYNRDSTHYIEAEVTATAIRILVDGVVKDTTAFVPATNTAYYLGFWLWAGYAVTYISTSVFGPQEYWNLVSNFTDYALTSTEIDYMEDSTGGGQPYFAGDVANTTELVHSLLVVPIRQSAGPRFYADFGIKPLQSLDVEKWTRSVKVSYAAAAGSLSAYIQNDIDSDLDTDSITLPLTVSITDWTNGDTSWRFWDTHTRNWTRFISFVDGTYSTPPTDRVLTPWNLYQGNVGSTGQGVGLRLVQDHIQVTDIRVKSWTIGLKDMRSGRNNE